MGILVGLTLPASIVLAQEVWSRGVGLASALVIGLGWVPGGIGAAVTGLLADKYSLAIGLRALLIAPIISVVCMLAFVALRRHREIRGSTQTK
jgi:FSR family fosmidomycin resistance protein-like MFS transporter